MTAGKATGRSQTDWARVDATGDEDIDFSDSREAMPEMLLGAVAVNGPTESTLLVAVDRRTARGFEPATKGRDVTVRRALRE